MCKSGICIRCRKCKCDLSFCGQSENSSKIMVELVIRMATVATASQASAIFAQMIFFASCFAVRDTFYFRSVAFGDCEFPKVEALQVFFVPHFTFAVLSVFGLLQRKYACILPHLALAGVYTTFCVFCQVANADEETPEQFAMDTLIAIGEVLYCFLLIRAYMQVRHEANIPPVSKIDYD